MYCGAADATESVHAGELVAVIVDTRLGSALMLNALEGTGQ